MFWEPISVLLCALSAGAGTNSLPAARLLYLYWWPIAFTLVVITEHATVGLYYSISTTAVHPCIRTLLVVLILGIC